MFESVLKVAMSKNCRKMARRSGPKRIYKSKCKKHLRFAPLLEVPMSQRCKTEEIDT